MKLLKKRRYNNTSLAATISIKDNVSTRNSSKICQTIADTGIEIPTPSQVGVQKRVISESKKTALKIKYAIKGAMFCLQFDGKRMNGEEYQIIILQNCDISFKLGIVKCNSGKAMDIFN